MPSLNQIFDFKNRKLTEMSARLSRKLKVEAELQQLPGLLQQGGLLLSSHLQSLLARPEMLQGVAEKLSKAVMGGRSGENLAPTDNNSKPTVSLLMVEWVEVMVLMVVVIIVMMVVVMNRMGVIVVIMVVMMELMLVVVCNLS